MMRLVRCFALLVCGAISSTAAGDVLHVDRATGQVTWENTTGFSIPFFGYWITSESGSLNPQGWLSIAENYDADSGGRLDPHDTWLIFNQKRTIVSEASFDGRAVLFSGETIDLGTGLWRVGGEEDLELVYLDDIVFEENPVPVEFFGTSPPLIPGDYNASGRVEQADLDLVLLNWGADGLALPPAWINDLPTGRIDQAELDSVLLNWGNTAAAAFTPAVAIPEPTTMVLLFCGLTTMVVQELRRPRIKA